MRVSLSQPISVCGPRVGRLEPLEAAVTQLAAPGRPDRQPEGVGRRGPGLGADSLIGGHRAAVILPTTGLRPAVSGVRAAAPGSAASLRSCLPSAPCLGWGGPPLVPCSQTVPRVPLGPFQRQRGLPAGRGGPRGVCHAYRPPLGEWLPRAALDSSTTLPRAACTPPLHSTLAHHPGALARGAGQESGGTADPLQGRPRVASGCVGRGRRG